MEKARLFKNGQSQAVRLPKQYRFTGEAVYLKRADNSLMLIPISNSWEYLIHSLDEFSDDFMLDRTQPETQNREAF